MDSSDWSIGIRYHTFDTTPDTEFKRRRFTMRMMMWRAVFISPHRRNAHCLVGGQVVRRGIATQVKPLKQDLKQSVVF